MAVLSSTWLHREVHLTFWVSNGGWAIILPCGLCLKPLAPGTCLGSGFLVALCFPIFCKFLILCLMVFAYIFNLLLSYCGLTVLTLFLLQDSPPQQQTLQCKISTGCWSSKTLASAYTTAEFWRRNIFTSSFLSICLRSSAAFVFSFNLISAYVLLLQTEKSRVFSCHWLSKDNF